MAKRTTAKPTPGGESLTAQSLMREIEALRKSQAIIEFEMDGTIITANKNFLEPMGYTLQEVQGQPHGMFVEPSYRASLEYQDFWDRLNRGQFMQGEYKRLGKNGKEVWIHGSYNPVMNEHGRPIKVIKYATDVTAQKLRNADFESQLAAIHKSQAVIQFEMDGTIIDANDLFLNAMGYTLEEVKGRHHRMFVDPETQNSAEYSESWAKLNRGEYTTGEYRRVDKAGNDVWIQGAYNPIFDLNGRPFKVVKYATDVTQRVKLERQLEAANARMSRDLEAAAKVQRSLLPSADVESSRIHFAWEYLPCDELAGDFLNFFALDDKHVAAFVVDVSGHGVASSLLSVTIGRLLTSTIFSTSLLMQEVPGMDEHQVVSPAEVAMDLNRRFPMEEQNGLYFTIVYGVLNLESLEFQFVSAGHDPLIHFRKSGPPVVVEGEGMGIGWLDDAEYENQVIQLEPGDRLYLYSDGVSEAMDQNMKQFGMQQMHEMLELGQSKSLDESVSLLFNSVKRWCGKKGPLDDVSILGLQVFDESSS